MKNILLGKTALLFSLIVIASSCEHKDLCYNHDEHSAHCSLVVSAKYDLSVEADYLGRTDESLYPSEPEGLRVLVYSENAEPSVNNLPTHGGKVNLTEGQHSLLFYNNDTEYIVFDDITSSVTARATTRSRSRASYNGNSLVSRDEKTVNPPDMLFGAYRDNYRSVMSMTNDSIQVTMHPLVYSYIVYFNVASGISSIAYARAALAGMAGSVYINSGVTSDEEVTVLFDCDVNTTQNRVESIFKSFGVPGYPASGYARGQHIYAIELELRLVNGDTIVFDYDVTDQVENMPHGGVITINNIIVPRVEPSGSAAPFEVDVSDWSDFQEIPITIK
jgi:hypothetical protein